MNVFNTPYNNALKYQDSNEKGAQELMNRMTFIKYGTLIGNITMIEFIKSITQVKNIPNNFKLKDLVEIEYEIIKVKHKDRDETSQRWITRMFHKTEDKKHV